MAGHPKNAVNVPLSKARDANGALPPPAGLARWLGSAGLDDHHTPAIYDGADGRNAAFLAWILAYLGRSDVRLMETFWEKWVAEVREVFYRPVRAAPRKFIPRPRPELRVTKNSSAEKTFWRRGGKSRSLFPSREFHAGAAWWPIAAPAFAPRWVFLRSRNWVSRSRSMMAPTLNGRRAACRWNVPRTETQRGKAKMLEKKLFPVSVVGSWPRPDWLIRALRRKQSGEITDREFQGKAAAR